MPAPTEVNIYQKIIDLKEIFKNKNKKVVVILKSLLDDGEIELIDGRRFVTHKSTLYHLDKMPKNCVRVADGFRIFSLAVQKIYLKKWIKNKIFFFFKKIE